MDTKPVGVRPALDTLRELDNGQFLDKLAHAIHDATGAVRDLGRGAKITIALDFAPLTKQNLTEPVITVEAEITKKLPKPDGHQALFYIDEGGNPTTQQQRQRDLGLTVAAGTTTNRSEGEDGTRQHAV